MGGKLNVYNLGEKGVNTSKTPLHHEDGEFLSAQNAEFYAEAGVGGLHKRPGLQRFNTTTLTNPIKGVIGVPLPGPGERGVYVDTGLTTSPWNVTHDGTTFAPSDGFQAFGARYPLAVHLFGQFFFSHNHGGTVWSVNGFDGEMEYELYRSADPAMNKIEVLGTHDGKIIFREEDTSFNQRIKLVDPLTGAVEQVAGILYTGLPASLHAACSFLGKVWVAYPGATALVSSARVTDTSWTLERTTAAQAGGGYGSMRVFNGELYVGYSASGTAALIEKRTAAGVWSTERTGSGSTSFSGFEHLTIHQNKLYANYHHDSAPGCITEIHVRSGGVWSIDKDLDAVDPTVSIYLRALLSVGQTIFCTVDADTTLVGGIWKKVGAGAWTRANALIMVVGQGATGLI